MTRWEKSLADQVRSSEDAEFWRAIFDRDPDVFNALVVDLHKAANGITPPTLDSLWDMLSPKFTTDPLGVAVRGLLAEQNRSLRWLSGRLCIARPPLTRMIDSEVPLNPISRARIELIADALGVHPSFFVEWRNIWFAEAVRVMFEARPELSASLYLRWSRHEVRARPLLVTSVPVERES